MPEPGDEIRARDLQRFDRYEDDGVQTFIRKLGWHGDAVLIVDQDDQEIALDGDTVVTLIDRPDMLGAPAVFTFAIAVGADTLDAAVAGRKVIKTLEGAEIDVFRIDYHPDPDVLFPRPDQVGP